MSLNDHTLGANKGVDMYPGIANPTASSTHANPLASNFVTDPTTEERGAGAGPGFDGHNQARHTFRETAGVVEGLRQPGSPWLKFPSRRVAPPHPWLASRLVLLIPPISAT